jgi:hypothetical protein
MRLLLLREKIGHSAMIKIANDPVVTKLHRRPGYIILPVLITLSATVIVSLLPPTPEPARAQGQTYAANQSPNPAVPAPLEQYQNLPLRGLTGSTSLGVYPTLDKGLLVTPGAHPVKVAVPLSQIISCHDQVIGKIERLDVPRGKYKGLLISVTNNADRPLLFDGDAAVVSSMPGGALPCVSLSTLAQLSVLPEQSDSFKRRFVTDAKATGAAAVTVGWVQTLHDQKRFSGPVVGPNGGRYGLDEQRREDELRRFGKRVLWPGDESSGVIYFDSPGALTGATINLPVSSYYDQDDRSTVSLHI